MFGIGTPELVVILVVALLVLGPKRLPEVARTLGKTLADLRRATSGMTEELSNARVMLEEETRAISRMASGKATPPGPPNPPPPPAPGMPPPNPPEMRQPETDQPEGGSDLASTTKTTGNA